jgi:hypothetical protein
MTNLPATSPDYFPVISMITFDREELPAGQGEEFI